MYIQYPKVLVPLPELDISFDTMRIESGIQFLFFVKARCALFFGKGECKREHSEPSLVSSSFFLTILPFEIILYSSKEKVGVNYVIWRFI